MSSPKNFAKVAFETAGNSRYPTTDKRLLQLKSGFVIGEMSFRFEHRGSSDDLPTDVIACDFRIPDGDGRVWLTTSRFTSELFITHLFDASMLSSMNLFTDDNADAEFLDAFEVCPLLSDVRYSSDDRFVRSLLIGDRVASVQFKYTTIVLDVAAVPDEDDDELPLLTKLAIRIRPGSLYDDEGRDLGALGYFMSCRHPLRNNTAAEDDGRWIDNPIPLPMVFSPTDAPGEPNDDVEVIE
jgi:hypothetical protein